MSRRSPESGPESIAALVDMNALDAVQGAARDAGDLLLKRRHATSTHATKEHERGAAGFVTEADVAAEALLRERLTRAFPGHAIFGEEGGWSAGGPGSDWAWFIDPLDGTSNYLRGLPLYGISVGLRQCGKPALGVLVFPALSLTLWGAPGSGSFSQGRPIRVSNRPISEALYYSGGFHRGVLQMSDELARASALTKIIDASSYELAQIAMGDAEIYYLTNVPHDVVAGISIVLGAGGAVTDEYGRPWSLAAGKILVTNGASHADAVAALANERRRGG